MTCHSFKCFRLPWYFITAKWNNNVNSISISGTGDQILLVVWAYMLYYIWAVFLAVFFPVFLVFLQTRYGTETTVSHVSNTEYRYRIKICYTAMHCYKCPDAYKSQTLIKAFFLVPNIGSYKHTCTVFWDFRNRCTTLILCLLLSTFSYLVDQWQSPILVTSLWLCCLYK